MCANTADRLKLGQSCLRTGVRFYVSRWVLFRAMAGETEMTRNRNKSGEREKRETWKRQRKRTNIWELLELWRSPFCGQLRPAERQMQSQGLKQCCTSWSGRWRCRWEWPGRSPMVRQGIVGCGRGLPYACPSSTTTDWGHFLHIFSTYITYILFFFEIKK